MYDIRTATGLDRSLQTSFVVKAKYENRRHLSDVTVKKKKVRKSDDTLTTKMQMTSDGRQ